VSESSTPWTTLAPGDRDGVVDVPENAETIYARVRAPGAEKSRSFDAPMTSLGRPPTYVGYDAQLVLEGDRCPLSLNQDASARAFPFERHLVGAN
jgi:hypothetical protein